MAFVWLNAIPLTEDLFISELIRAANGIGKITASERSGLLFRAAGIIKEMREIGYSDTPASESGPDDVRSELTEMARLITLIADDEVAAAMLNAVETIKDCRKILEAKLHAPTEGKYYERSAARSKARHRLRNYLPPPTLTIGE